MPAIGGSDGAIAPIEAPAVWIRIRFDTVGRRSFQSTRIADAMRPRVVRVHSYATRCPALNRKEQTVIVARTAGVDFLYGSVILSRRRIRQIEDAALILIGGRRARRVSHTLQRAWS